MRSSTPTEDTATKQRSFRDDPRWHIAEQVAKSSVLSRAAQLRAILLYIVRRSLEEPDEVIREYDIAYSVLGRKADFNPVEDNIVRVQMGHLRKKLDIYFGGEGASETTTITVPVGSYTPAFIERRPILTEPAKAALDPAVTPPQSLLSNPSNAEPETQRRWITSRIWTKWSYFVLPLLLVAAYLLWPRGHAAGKSASGPSATLKNPILKELFNTGRPVYTVLADTSLVTLQNTVHSDISVSEYLDPRYPDNVLAKTADPALRQALKVLALHHYTSLDDADVVARTSEWATRLGGHMFVRYARLMHVRDFEAGNFIIVGSRRGNPWTSLFAGQLNFVYSEDPRTHEFYFRNQHPKPGEDTSYQLAPDSDGGTVTYVDIAMVPNLARTGTVLLLNGFSMESNEAAMNILFSDHLPEPISSAATRFPGGPLEVLLRVHNVDSAERGYEIVSIRAGSQ